MSLYEEIEKIGYLILPNIISIPSWSGLTKDIKQLDKQMYPIFKRANKSRRYQAHITPKQKQLNNLVDEVIDKLQSQLPLFSFKNPVLLKSDPGCQVQPAHSDLGPSIAVDSNNPTIVQSLGLLLCLQPDTTLTVWKGLKNNNIEAKNGPPVLPSILLLHPGDILLFLGNQIHAGSAYEIENYRIHIYLESIKQKIETNKTWRVDQNTINNGRCVEILQNIDANDFDSYLHVIQSPESIEKTEFYEIDSLTEEEYKEMIQQNGKECYVTTNIQPLQGNADPYPAPSSHTRRSPFTGYTKALWYRSPKDHQCHYYAFSCQSKIIQTNPQNLQAGTTLFWVQEKNEHNQYYLPQEQLPVLYCAIEDA
jgi:hypothetical protein